MRAKHYPLPLPDYAVNLLMVAKDVLAHENLSSLGDEHLGLAVEAFEDAMPLSDEGEIIQIRGV